MCGVQQLQVGVGLVVGVPLAVLRQRPHLGIRDGLPPRGRFAVGGALVEVVAAVQHGVDVGLGDAGVGVEEAVVVLRAGRHREAESLDRLAGRRSRPGATDR